MKAGISGASSLETTVWAVIGLIVVVGWTWLNDWPIWGNGIHVYLGDCTTNAAEPSACPKWSQVYEPAIFVADFQTQRVIKQVSGLGPEPLENCTVRNQRNWRCVSSIAHYERKMVEGAYSETGMQNAAFGGATHQLSPWRWWWLSRLQGVSVSTHGF